MNESHDKTPGQKCHRFNQEYFLGLLTHAFLKAPFPRSPLTCRSPDSTVSILSMYFIVCV